MTPRAALLAIVGRGETRSLDTIERDLADEFDAHLYALEAEGQRSGLAADEAAHWARTRFGDVENLQAQCRRIAMEEHIMGKRIHLFITWVLALIVLTMGLGLVMSVRAQTRQMDEAQQAQAEAMLHAQWAAKAQSFLTSVVTAADATTGGDETVEDILNNASAQIDTDLQDRPELAAQLRATIEAAKAKLEEDQRDEDQRDEPRAEDTPKDS